MARKRKLDWIVSVRFKNSDAREMQRRAQRMGITMSAYLRMKALEPETLYIPTCNSFTSTMAGPVLIHYPEAAD